MKRIIIILFLIFLCSVCYAETVSIENIVSLSNTTKTVLVYIENPQRFCGYTIKITYPRDLVEVINLTNSLDNDNLFVFNLNKESTILVASAWINPIFDNGIIELFEITINIKENVNENIVMNIEGSTQTEDGMEIETSFVNGFIRIVHSIINTPTNLKVVRLW